MRKAVGLDRGPRRAAPCPSAPRLRTPRGANKAGGRQREKEARNERRGAGAGKGRGGGRGCRCCSLRLAVPRTRPGADVACLLRLLRAGEVPPPPQKGRQRQEQHEQLHPALAAAGAGGGGRGRWRRRRGAEGVSGEAAGGPARGGRRRCRAGYGAVWGRGNRRPPPALGPPLPVRASRRVPRCVCARGRRGRRAGAGRVSGLRCAKGAGWGGGSPCGAEGVLSGAWGGGQRRRGEAPGAGVHPPRGAAGRRRRTCLRFPPACRGRGDSSRFDWFPSRVLGLAGLIPLLNGFPPLPGQLRSVISGAGGESGVGPGEVRGAASRWARGLPAFVAHGADPLGGCLVVGEEEAGAWGSWGQSLLPPYP